MNLTSASPSPPLDEINRIPEETLSLFASEGEGGFTDCKQVAKIRFPKSGMGSQANIPTRTLSSMVADAVLQAGNKAALRTEANLPPFEKGNVPVSAPLTQWKSWTYQEYSNDIDAVAKGFIQLGLVPFDAVSIFGFNSPEW
jgi:hypothetical protein